MFILSAIGRFFAKIGRWIKNTAWVQPLLIVGGIFAIIFSIPYITKWVGSWFDSANASESFYKEYKVSLENSEKGTSDANKLFNYMVDYDHATEDEKNKYGSKFFVIFTEEDCAGCATAYEGFKILRDNWGKNEFTFENNDVFKMYTIFTDEENDDDENLFKTYFYNSYGVYFEEMNANLTASYYYSNAGGESSSYNTNLNTLSDIDSFAVPTILLVDFDYVCPQATTSGVTEILFSVDEKTTDSGSYGKARTLYDCWNHADKFGPNYNA